MLVGNRTVRSFTVYAGAEVAPLLAAHLRERFAGQLTVHFRNGWSILEVLADSADQRVVDRFKDYCNAYVIGALHQLEAHTRKALAELERL